jgi:hypothetical protein
VILPEFIQIECERRATSREHHNRKPRRTAPAPDLAVNLLDVLVWACAY